MSDQRPADGPSSSREPSAGERPAPSGPPGGASRGPATSGEAPGGGSPSREYSGSGAWGPAALWLLGGLFVLSAAATVHSILATFGG